MLWHCWAHTDSCQLKALEVPALGSQLLMGKLEAHKCLLTRVPMNGMGACVPGAKPYWPSSAFLPYVDAEGNIH